MLLIGPDPVIEGKRANTSITEANFKKLNEYVSSIHKHAYVPLMRVCMFNTDPSLWEGRRVQSSELPKRYRLLETRISRESLFGACTCCVYSYTSGVHGQSRRKVEWSAFVWCVDLLCAALCE